jgi:para-nitrobenzyl esterase
VQFGGNYPIDYMAQAAKGTHLIVSMHYRMGPFGFLGSTELQARSLDGSTGNYGHQDQRLAMQWVRANIGAFGGRTSSITIFGESAGGMSIINHLATPKSFPFYDKGIIESGTYASGAKTLATQQAQWDGAVNSTGCGGGNGSGSVDGGSGSGDGGGSLACILKLDARKIIARVATRANSGKWYPTIDGAELSEAGRAVQQQSPYTTRVQPRRTRFLH